jgi:hypothetical protein
VVKVFKGEVGTAPPPAARRNLDLVGPGDRGTTWAYVAPLALAASRLTDGLDELRDLPQGGTVLGVVGQQLILPTLIPGLFPPCPPHQTLEPRGIRLGPGAAEVVADFLQAVPECGEVHAGVDNREYIHRLHQGAINEAFPLHYFPHPSQQRLLIAPIVEQDEVLVSLQKIQEGIERFHLLVRAVRPEGIGSLRFVLDDDYAEKVGKARVLIALGIEEDLHGLLGQVRCAQDVDLLLADRQGLQGTVAGRP